MTSTNAKPAEKKQNAAQKLEGLERAFMAQNAQIEILAEEIDNLKIGRAHV